MPLCERSDPGAQSPRRIEILGEMRRPEIVGAAEPVRQRPIVALLADHAGGEQGVERTDVGGRAGDRGHDLHRAARPPATRSRVPAATDAAASRDGARPREWRRSPRRVAGGAVREAGLPGRLLRPILHRDHADCAGRRIRWIAKMAPLSTSSSTQSLRFVMPARRRLLQIFFVQLGLRSRRSPVLAADARRSRAQSAPSFVDPDLRLDRPTLTGVRAIRFLTTDDYPPLNFAARGRLAERIQRRYGARDLQGSSTSDARSRRAHGIRWSTRWRPGKATRSSPRSRRRTPFGRRSIFRSPTTRRRPASSCAATPPRSRRPRPDWPEGRSASSPEPPTKPTSTCSSPKLCRSRSRRRPTSSPALKSNAIAVAFADGVTFSIWLNGEAAADCCEFRGGPYLESRFFGEGVGIAVRKDDDELRQAFNWALGQIMKNGAYAEIYLKYFPISFY